MWLHRWTGLAIAGFLVTTGLTGALLAFADELDALLAPAVFVAAAGPDGVRRRDPIDLRDEAAKRHPGARLDWVDLETPPDRTLRFALDPRAKDQVDGDDEIFVDPYTGREVASRRRGDLSQGWKNAMAFVDGLHQSLALGSLGATVLGVASLLWTIDCLVGLVLTFPLRQREMPTTARRWLRRWKPAWIVRWWASPARITFDLHRAAGLWVWLLLLVFSWSSVGFNLPTVYRPVMAAIFGSLAGTESLVSWRAVQTGEPSIGWQQAHRLASAAMSDAARRQGFRVDHERLLHYDVRSDAYEYRVASSRDVGVRNGNTTVFLDAETGVVRRLALPTGQSSAATVGTWIMAVHTASVGGTAGQLLVTFMGMVVAGLSVTGVLIWQRKRVGRRAADVSRVARG